MQRPSVLAPASQALAVTLVALVVYCLTLAPDLMYTDSGELAAACAVGGVAHPTGYPLFTILGHTWLALPWSSPIQAMNLLSAVMVALSAGVLVYVIRTILAPPVRPVVASAAAIGGGMAYALCGTVWAQATSVEVYALHALLLMTTLLCTLRGRHVASPSTAIRWTALAGLSYGLMLTNHLTSVALAPGFLWLWWSGLADRRQVRRLLPWLVGPALLALALYAWLPLRSAQDPPINWGGVHRSWAAFWYHVRGTQFGVWLFSDKAAAKANTLLFLRMIPPMTGWLGIVFVAGGVGALLRHRNRSLGIGLLALAAGNLALAVGYAIPDIDSYFLPALAVIAIVMAVGIASLLDRERLRWMLPIAALLPLAGAVMEWPRRDLSSHNAVRSYTEWMLANMEPDAVLISHQWDYAVSALWYIQTVEGRRTDVTVVDKELLRRTWYPDFLLRQAPAVMGPVRTTIDAYMPLLMRFESDGDAFKQSPADVQAIQRRFVDVLNAIVETNAGRPVYITPELLQDERGFPPRSWGGLPVGPLIRLTRDTAVDQRSRRQGVVDLIASLHGRDERLDSGIRSAATLGLIRSALSALHQHKDTVAYSRFREDARTLDPGDPNLSRLPRLLP